MGSNGIYNDNGLYLLLLQLIDSTSHLYSLSLHSTTFHIHKGHSQQFMKISHTNIYFTHEKKCRKFDENTTYDEFRRFFLFFV
jgi:hypothetical protein